MKIKYNKESLRFIPTENENLPIFNDGKTPSVFMKAYEAFAHIGELQDGRHDHAIILSRELDEAEQKEVLEIMKSFDVDKMRLELAKENKIKEINQAAGELIKASYPSYKQFNINNLQKYTQKDKDAMWSFINTIRDASNAQVASINSKETLDEIAAIEVDLKGNTK